MTVDLDFGYLLAISKFSVPSVILFRLNNASRDVIEQRLIEILEKCENELEKGAIISVSDEDYRIRLLPI